jgi:hypothetical protein
MLRLLSCGQQLSQASVVFPGTTERGQRIFTTYYAARVT